MNSIDFIAHPSHNLVADFLRITAFPIGNDIWRIDWFGSIAFPDRYSRQRHPSVLVYLSKVEAPEALAEPAVLLQPESTASAQYQTKRWVSVGTLMLLRIGDLWQNQTLIAHPSYEQETFEDLHIDHSHVTLVKAGVSLEDGIFLLPLAQHPWHLNNTHSYCTCVELPDDRRLVVPCMEMIRFYFGSSSELLSRLFTPPLTKDRLFKYFKHSNPEQLTVALADRMPRSSAEDIARIAVSPAAWRAAVSISTSCLKESVSGQGIYPQAHFPFEGSTTLQVTGKWLPLGDQSRKTFLAYQVHSCTHPFPFKSLFAIYNNPARASRSSRPPAQESGSNFGDAPRHSAAPPQQPRLKERDPSDRLARATASSPLHRRFPDLEHKPVSTWSVPISNRKPAAPAGRVPSVEDLAVGESGSIQHIRPVDLVEQRNRNNPEPPPFLQCVIAALTELQSKGYTVLTLTAGDEDGWTIPISGTLAADPDGVIDDRFLIAEEGHRPRRMAAFQLSREGRHHVLTVIEFNPLIPHVAELRSGSIGDLFNLLANMAFMFVTFIDTCREQGFGFDPAAEETPMRMKNWLLSMMSEAN